MKKVYVVTGLELGWDCVVKVFDASKVKIEDVLVEYPEGEYVVFKQDVETAVEL